MHEFLRSATKFSLLVFICVLAMSMTLVVVFNLHNETMISGIKDLFANVMVSIISFYFGQKGMTYPNTGTTSNTTNNDV